MMRKIDRKQYPSVTVRLFLMQPIFFSQKVYFDSKFIDFLTNAKLHLILDISKVKSKTKKSRIRKL